MYAILSAVVLLSAAGRGRAEPAPEDLRAWLAKLDLPRTGSSQKTERGRPSPEVGREGALAPELLTASVLICSASDDLAAAKAAVDAEQQAVHRVGVADLTRLEEQKLAAARAERARITALRQLHERRLAPLGCEEPEVARLVKCVHRMDAVSPAEWCDDPAWHDFQERVSWDS